jgi:serine phosphatase RsbU (regulator of sigma subunit)
MFVTCFYAILDPKNGHLRYANAGNDLPYLRRRNGDDAEELRARRMPLGLMPGMGYEEKSLGDFLLEDLYSFTGEGWEQEDDITLLTLRRSASLS